MTRTCRWCSKEFQPVTGNQFYCSATHKRAGNRGKDQQARRVKNKIENDKRTRHNLKALAERLSEGCMDCQLADIRVLDMHHRVPSEKLFGCSSKWAHRESKARFRRELAKCDTLCKNCHAIRHYEEGDHSG